MSYGADWICECGWANLDVRKRCRNCGKEIDWKARAETAEASLAKLKERALEVVGPFCREAAELAPAIDDAHVYTLADWPDLGVSYFMVGDLRAARAFEKELKDG